MTADRKRVELNAAIRHDARAGLSGGRFSARTMWGGAP